MSWKSKSKNLRACGMVCFGPNKMDAWYWIHDFMCAVSGNSYMLIFGRLIDRLVYHHMGSYNMIIITMERPLNARLIRLKEIIEAIKAKLPGVAALALASGRQEQCSTAQTRPSCPGPLASFVLFADSQIRSAGTDWYLSGWALMGMPQVEM